MFDPDKVYSCKLGITKNPNQRIKPYRTSNPNCYFYKIYKLQSDRSIVKKYERELLATFQTIFTVRSEYIKASPKMVSNIIESYFDDLEISINCE